MDPLCKNPRCGLRHPASWNCARALYEAQKALPVVETAEQPLVLTEPIVLTPSVNKDRHKPGYMREYMKRRRAALKA